MGLAATAIIIGSDEMVWFLEMQIRLTITVIGAKKQQHEYTDQLQAEIVFHVDSSSMRAW